MCARKPNEDIRFCEERGVRRGESGEGSQERGVRRGESGEGSQDRGVRRGESETVYLWCSEARVVRR